MSQVKIDYTNTIRHLDAAIRELEKMRDTIRKLSPSPLFESPQACEHEVFSQPTEAQPLQICCKLCPSKWPTLKDYIGEQLPFLKN